MQSYDIIKNVTNDVLQYGGKIMVFKDYYKILELNTNKVSIEEIKIAYRDLAKKYHPDVNVGDRIAEERFKDVNEAYRVLSDSSSKKKYDRMWISHAGKKKNFEESRRSQGSFASDFFTMFFGQSKEENVEKNINTKKKKIPSKGENIETEINISIEEAFFGLEKKISLRTVNGKMKTFSIKIPEGIRNGEKIRLMGQGKEGKNGGKNGDLFIKIQIEDNNKFKLKGQDLITNLYLTPWEAALGTRVSISGIDDTVNLFVPPGIQSGERVKIASKGYKDGKGGRGDLVTEIKIMVPKHLSDEEKQLFERLNEVSNFNPRGK